MRGRPLTRSKTIRPIVTPSEPSEAGVPGISYSTL